MSCSIKHETRKYKEQMAATIITKCAAYYTEDSGAFLAMQRDLCKLTLDTLALLSHAYNPLPPRERLADYPD